MRRKLVTALMMLLSIAILGGCGWHRPMHDDAMAARHNAMHGGPPASLPVTAVETLNVTIENFAFSPPVIEVSLGVTVTWKNRDAAVHTVTFKNAPFRSELLAQNESWSHTFSEAGTYSYFCEPHPWMTGQVIVQQE